MNRIVASFMVMFFPLLDMVMTLTGQPLSYWYGNYATACEANPLGKWLLVRNPAYFIMGTCGYMTLVFIGAIYLPKFLAKLVITCILLGHTLGALSWLMNYPCVQLWNTVVIFAGIASVLYGEAVDGTLPSRTPKV